MGHLILLLLYLHKWFAYLWDFSKKARSKKSAKKRHFMPRSFFDWCHLVTTDTLFIWIPQCGNSRIFLPLRFYVKSILSISEAPKLLFWQVSRLWFLILVNFCPQKLLKLTTLENPSVQNFHIIIFRGHSEVVKTDFT